MSQVNEDNPQATSAVEDDEALFAEGFNLGDDDGESAEDPQGDDQQQTDDSREKAPEKMKAVSDIYLNNFLFPSDFINDIKKIK